MSEPMPGWEPAEQEAAAGREPAAAQAGGPYGGQAPHAPEDPGAAPQAPGAAPEAPHAPEAPREDAAAAGGAPQEDEGPRPLGLRLVPTGHAPLDARLERLADVDRLAVAGHLEVYEDVHGALRGTLAALDRPGPGPEPGHGPGPRAGAAGPGPRLGTPPGPVPRPLPPPHDVHRPHRS